MAEPCDPGQSLSPPAAGLSMNVPHQLWREAVWKGGLHRAGGTGLPLQEAGREGPLLIPVCPRPCPGKPLCPRQPRASGHTSCITDRPRSPAWLSCFGSVGASGAPAGALRSSLLQSGSHGSQWVSGLSRSHRQLGQGQDSEGDLRPLTGGGQTQHGPGSTRLFPGESDRTRTSKSQVQTQYLTRKIKWR